MEENLKELGLSDKEIEVYLNTLKRGKTTPSRIARETGIKRSTVYAVLDGLRERELVSQDIGGKILYILASPPENLLNEIEKRRRKLSREEYVARKAIEQIKDRNIKASYAAPRIRFIEEKDLTKFLDSRIAEWANSALKYDKTYWGFQDKTFVQHYKKWVDKRGRIMPEEGVYLKMLTNETDAEKELQKKYPRRMMRFWKYSGDFTTSTWVLGDYILSLSTRDRPHYAVETHDSAMAANMRRLFSAIWSELGYDTLD